MTIRKSMLLSLSIALLTVGCTTLSGKEAIPEAPAQGADTAAQRGKIAVPPDSVPAPSEEAVAPSNDDATQADAVPLEEAPASNAPEIAFGGTANGIPVPVADSAGDFSTRVGYNLWKVVDPDPAGVNCRWSPEMPTEWYSPGADWPDGDFQNWPVVRTFAKGKNLTSNGTPAGFMTVMDSRRLPWLKIAIGENDQICLVRANTRYIVPRP
ncbi:MAG: hypothetical protein AB8B99_03640 [Phormidesmis sp.]